MSERDRAVVDAYARTGMSLETLVMSFPQFAKEDVNDVYNEYKLSISYGEDNLHSGI